MEGFRSGAGFVQLITDPKSKNIRIRISRTTGGYTTGMIYSHIPRRELLKYVVTFIIYEKIFSVFLLTKDPEPDSSILIYCRSRKNLLPGVFFADYCSQFWQQLQKFLYL
jgi:hypothetical protein